MLYRKPRVGQEISAYCGKCKDERSHTVTAMDGETVKKVTCAMCGSLHNYKQSAATTTERASKSRGTTSSKATGTKRSREVAAFSIDPKRPVKSYNMDSSFAAGDVISHPKFGLGSVESSPAPNKIEVRFQEGKKMLVHNLKSVRH
ncbi:MAG TPA: hypothetical protein VKA70_03110 [Blastocatellia bacterium]|nr:hypothetical protein [Blastocatellia bacterium]